jgi:CheY-like chemotaxis protein
VAEFEIQEAAHGMEALEVPAGSGHRSCFSISTCPGSTASTPAGCCVVTAGAAATMIVMLTAAHGDAIEREAATAGVDRYLTKPFSPLDPLRLVDPVAGQWS